MHPIRHAFVAAALCSASFPVSAQSFNVDVTHGNAFSLPSSSYGAAANQPGAWTRVGASQAPTPLSFPLADIAGQATPARLETFGGSTLYWCGPPCNGDFNALMGDGLDVGGMWEGYPWIGRASWTFQNLLPGVYRVYTYAAGGSNVQTWVETVGSPVGVQVLSGAWTSPALVLGDSYALHTVVVASSFTVRTEDPGFDNLQRAKACGFQLAYLGAVGGASFCAGDGTGSACPCGNTSAPGSGAGCANSTGAGGLLLASGAASLSGDTLVLTVTGLPNGSSVLFFQGTQLQNGGAGTAFGDGLRCVAGTLTRLGTQDVAATQSWYPGSGDSSVSARGGITVPGGRSYQAWYRNAATFCTPATFNLTNGVRIDWGA